MEPHASAADVFPHVRVVLGMVVGLGVTRILSGFARIVQHPTQYPLYPVHLAWSAMLLLVLVHLLRSAKIAKARRAGAKLSSADVADIRASTEKDHVLAERYGVSRAYVSSIQLHRRWRDHTISPWAGMGAR